MRITNVRSILLMLLACFLSACASGKPVVKERYFWPPPPDDPKIEWIGVYYDKTDLPGNSGSKIVQNLIGQTEEIKFSSPLFVTSNSKGRVVVSDPDLKAFVNIDLVNNNFTLLGGAAMADVVKPTGVAFDAEGLVYAGDDPSRKIYVVNDDNKVVKVLDLSNDIKSVGSFVIDKKLNRIIIPDTRSHKITVFSLDGKLLNSFGKRGELEGEFNQPMSAALDRHGNIYITDSFNARIQIFTPDGVYISKIGKRGDSLGDFGIIKGVALDSDENVYVTDARFHRIQIFNTKGELLMTLGAPHSQQRDEPIVAAGLLLPYGLFIDDTNRIYVADMMNRRLQVFQYMPEKKPVK
ncbi:MAG: 6-bladed beta-propeller [Geobacter sp.]|nr:6-bladed beta-propeller [Geobacter sp.]